MWSIILLGLTAWSIEYICNRANKKRLGHSFLFNLQLYRLASVFVLTILGYHFGLFRLQFLRFGYPESQVHPVSWLGIGTEENWISLSQNFLVIISLVTFMSIYLPNRDKIEFKRLLSIKILISILVLAFINALTEEMLFRVLLVDKVGQSATRDEVLIGSAVFFGLPHYFGYPSRWLGILLASFLGWFLGKAMLETNGAFLPILYHFVQDIVILALLFIIPINKTAKTQNSPYSLFLFARGHDEVAKQTVLALSTALLLILAACLQFGLASGMPWGSISWGGRYPEILPVGLRIASFMSFLLLIFFAHILTAYVGLMKSVIPAHYFRPLLWLQLAISILNIASNILSESFWEKVLMTPISIILSASVYYLLTKGSSTRWQR